MHVPVFLQSRHDKTLGGWAGGTKGEQCQANSSSAGVHSQRQTMETTTGCLPGGGWETTQEGEGWDREMLASVHVWLINSIKSKQAFGRDCVKSRWEDGRKKVVWKWKAEIRILLCQSLSMVWIMIKLIVLLGDRARVPEQPNPSDQIPKDWTQPNHRRTGEYAKG